jgi:hypothetical protein
MHFLCDYKRCNHSPAAITARMLRHRSENDYNQVGGTYAFLYVQEIQHTCLFYTTLHSIRMYQNLAVVIHLLPYISVGEEETLLPRCS